MNSQQLLDEILGILRTVKDDKAEMQKILDFLQAEILIEEEDDDIEIPAKFQPIVKTIAENIEAGLVCFLNPDTLEIEDIPQEFADNFHEMEMTTGITEEELNLKHSEWENGIEFYPLESSESFRIMENFAEQLTDKALKNKLINALQNRKPFANFNRIIHNSDCRQDWFDFKSLQVQNHVKYFLANQES